MSGKHCDEDTMVDLGLYAWWGLNQYSNELCQPEQLELAGEAETLHSTDDWSQAANPLEAWRDVVLRHLLAFCQATTGFIDKDEERVLLRRQLLFIAYQTERALAYLASR